MKIQPRPSIPTTQNRTPAELPKRPPPRVDDGFEASRSGPVSLGTPNAEKSPGDKLIELARSVMGQNAHDLKLANNTTLGDAMQDWVPDNVNCANFVSGLLISTGQIPKSEGHAGVGMLVANLKKDPNFVSTTLDQAKPGDVVAFEYTHKDGTKGQHVVVFAGRDDQGRPKFIGSNNTNKDGSQRIGETTGVPAGWRPMAVMHYQGANPSTNPTAPSGPSPSAPTAPTGPSAPSGGTTATSVEGITADHATWLRGGSRGAGVEDLQKKLKEAGFDPGPLDGQFGPKTREAVMAYQRAKGLAVDGIVGPQTRASLLGLPVPEVPTRPSPSGPSGPSGADGPSGPSGADGPVAPTPSGNTATAQALEAQALKMHGPEFVQKVKEMATRLGVKPEWILAVMKNESGMKPDARNPNGGATGLIQFMPATARGLGTSTEALSKMSATEQLKYVEKYFTPFAGKIKSGSDLYMATFWPAGVGKPDSYNIGGADVAKANPIFDLNKNGQITAGEFREYYRKRYPELS
ncbi:MAG: peptidoglycan-binding protein [Myxococcaceae bacterium]